MLRIGHGYDVHAFGGGNPLILGGELFPEHLGLEAHSDGDVLFHAICDSLLGAAGLGDIGKHFPDNDQRYKDADSGKLLQQVNQLVVDKGYKISNLDVTVIAQTPRMSNHINNIVSNVSSILSIKNDQVNIKATTTENLGYIGRKEGIAVHSVCLIQSASI